MCAKATFNVLTDPWIPVFMLDGRRKTIGLRELFQNAHEIKEISVTSPLEEYALYRFASVFLMDALRPKRESDLRSMLVKGKFDMNAISAYITQCEKEGVSFDLFDQDRPFMQSAFVPEWDGDLKPVSAIDFFLPSGNNPMYHDHEDPWEKTLSFARAARLLLALQQFCLASVQHYPSGMNGAPPFFCVIKEENLFRTLVLTLTPLNAIDMPFDRPPAIWRATTPVEPKKKVEETSWMRGMFFPARRVLLVPSEDATVVAGVYVAQGENYINKADWRDPFVAYETTKKGFRALRPQGNKPIWQSVCDIADIPGHNASTLLKQYLDLVDTDYARVTLYGVEIKPGKVVYVNLHRYELRLPAKMTTNEAEILLLRKCVEAAETIAKALGKSITEDHTLSKTIANRAVECFYQMCEHAFWTMCNSMSEKTVQEQIHEYNLWCSQICDFAKKAHTEVTQDLHLRGNDLGKMAANMRILFAACKKTKKEAMKFDK